MADHYKGDKWPFHQLYDPWIWSRTLGGWFQVVMSVLVWMQGFWLKRFLQHATHSHGSGRDGSWLSNGGFLHVCQCSEGRFFLNVSISAFAFFFQVEITLHPPTPLFKPGSVHSGSAGWDDWGWAFPDELCVSSFLWHIYDTMSGQDSQPTLTSLGQGCRCI